MMNSLFYSYLSIVEEKIIGVSFVIKGDKLKHSEPLSQCIVQVFGVDPQFLILCGLEKEE